MRRIALAPAFGALAFGALAFGALAVPAVAAPVDLRDRPVSHGAAVTLGDLFDGAGAASSVVVGEAAPAGGETVLESGRVQSLARRAGLEWANPTGRRRIVVGATDTPRASASRSADAPVGSGRGRSHGGARVLAYARSINAGEVVAASDLVWSDAAVAPADAPSDADAVIGKAARRPLREGAAVGGHDLASPRLIARGDAVDVAFEDDGISLVLQAKAQGDAALGDSLTLVNTASKKTLEAVASGPGKAVVGPRADALKAAAASGLILASR